MDLLPDDQPLAYSEQPDVLWQTHLNVVVHVVGSRGDVQPFVALGTELQRFGHRVRLATHDVFADFVRDSGLEFFPIGGDPAELMAYMVKSPGLIPSMDSFQQGDIGKKRAMITEMLDGCWKACIEPDPLTQAPFVANAIIANPPSFAHIHCAEALAVPVHLMFTMPWSATREFPHPLANIQHLVEEPGVANYWSYRVVEWMTWQGLGGIINRFRRKLDLEPVPRSDGPVLVDSLKVPFTYCWSPGLVSKPRDWHPHIDICGFFFRDAPQYTPPPDIKQFLEEGPPPIYIGFGSIVIEDPAALTKIILDSVAACRVRAIVSRGWSKLGAPTYDTKNLLFIDDCPHEWLFQHVAAVIHHGGAGTTACGLLNARPTAIVPFFGDQPFWGDMVAVAGAGPKPIRSKDINSQNLREAITFCLSPEVAEAAAKLAQSMHADSGVKSAMASFHRHLQSEHLSCDLAPEHSAVWVYTKSKRTFKLSSICAEVLIDHQRIDRKHLKLLAVHPIHIESRRIEPVTGGLSALLETFSGMIGSAAGIFLDPYKEYQRIANSKTPDGKSSENPAVAMPLASLKSIGRFNSSLFKGTMVDIPLAVTIGFLANTQNVWRRTAGPCAHCECSKRYPGGRYAEYKSDTELGGWGTRGPLWRVREPYWEDQGAAELGWAWENEVFGGAVRDDNLEDFDRPIIGWVNEWPDRPTLQKEAGRNGPEWPYVTAGLMPRLEENVGLEGRYFISMHYIHAVQQQSNWELFWDQRDKIKRNFDMELNIRIPKGIGFLGEWGEGKWVNMKKEEIRYRQPLPRAICNAEHSEPAILERKGFVGI